MNLIIKRVEEFLSSNEEVKSVVIWGGGQVGESIAEIIDTKFPKVEFLGIIDSSIEEMQVIGRRRVYPISFLKDNYVDTIIIASVAFENEIYSKICSSFPKFIDHVFRISQSNFIECKLDLIRNNNYYSELVELIYEYPDNSGVWKELAYETEDDNIKRIYFECSSFLE